MSRGLAEGEQKVSRGNIGLLAGLLYGKENVAERDGDG